MLTRILSGLTLIAVLLVVLLGLPPIATIVLASVVVALAAHEFVRLAAPDGGNVGLAAVLAAVVTALCLASRRTGPDGVAGRADRDWELRGRPGTPG